MTLRRVSRLGVVTLTGHRLKLVNRTLPGPKGTEILLDEEQRVRWEAHLLATGARRMPEGESGQNSSP
jgi:hypothetical protein